MVRGLVQVYLSEADYQDDKTLKIQLEDGMQIMIRYKTNVNVFVLKPFLSVH